MIDGVKLMTHIYDVNAFRLHTSSVISWVGNFDVSTGEVINKAKAGYKGLKLSLAKSQNDGYWVLTIGGSLQVFGLGGTKTKECLTMVGIQNTIIDLSELLGIEAESIVIQNIEVSCTIQLNMTVASFLHQLVGQFRPYKRSENDNRTNKEFNGIAFVRDSYVFKVYDKGLEIDKIKSNILRIEVAVKESKLIRDKYEIHNLSDLAKAEKVNRLFDFLEKQLLDSVIINDEILSESEKAKAAQWINPNYWSDLDREKRYREKIRLQKWLLDTNVDKAKYDVLYTMRKAWYFAMTEQMNKYDIFGDNINVTIGTKYDIFDCKISSSKMSYLPNKESKKVEAKEVKNQYQYFAESEPEKQRTILTWCIECKTQKITGRSDKKYCSEKCRIKANSKKLNESRKRKRVSEFLALENLKHDFDKIKVKYILKYKLTGEQTKVQLAQLAQMKLSEIVKINKVEIAMTKSKTLILTKQRAKIFLRWQRVAQLANLPQAATYRW